MKIEIVNSLGTSVGTLWRKLQKESIRSNGNFYVSSPLSSTPLPIYSWIVKNCFTFLDWDRIRFVLMDEQIEGKFNLFNYINIEDKASYERFARQHLLIPLEKKLGFPIPVIKPELAKIRNFELENPIDLLILALGVKGNYANVMPNTDKTTSRHIASLIPEFRSSHTSISSTSYAGARFREYGMSLGPKQVLASRTIVIIISGQRKKKLTKQLFSYNKFDPSFPLSIIHEPEISDRVTIYLTEELSDCIPQF